VTTRALIDVEAAYLTVGNCADPSLALFNRREYRVARKLLGRKRVDEAGWNVMQVKLGIVQNDGEISFTGLRAVTR
jgi:hypothetical protein